MFDVADLGIGVLMLEGDRGPDLQVLHVLVAEAGQEEDGGSHYVQDVVLVALAVPVLLVQVGQILKHRGGNHETLPVGIARHQVHLAESRRDLRAGLPLLLRQGVDLGPLRGYDANLAYLLLAPFSVPQPAHLIDPDAVQHLTSRNPVAVPGDQVKGAHLGPVGAQGEAPRVPERQGPLAEGLLQLLRVRVLGHGVRLPKGQHVSQAVPGIGVEVTALQVDILSPLPHQGIGVVREPDGLAEHAANEEADRLPVDVEEGGDGEAVLVSLGALLGKAVQPAFAGGTHSRGATEQVVAEFPPAQHLKVLMARRVNLRPLALPLGGAAELGGALLKRRH